MPKVFAFPAVQFAKAFADAGHDVSAFVAPPYDVLDQDAKDRLLSREPNNVVGIDLPHLPAKSAGPAAVYENAGNTFRSMIEKGVMQRRPEPVMFAYRQTYEFGGTKYERTGMACCVETLPFGPRSGGGILPHEQTFSGPKEDRFALMKAARAQFSPIFGLHPDDDGRATQILRNVCASRNADTTANTDDGVKHELWTIADRETIAAYADALAGEDVFVADGHHRYTTALNYLAQLEKDATVPADHPARRCMIVLVGMSDPGLIIGPTHRVLGGMQHYTWEKFLDAAVGSFVFHEVMGGIEGLNNQLELECESGRENVLGFYDFASGRGFLGSPKKPDPLEESYPNKPRAWRTLDVAIIQHLIVEKICQPRLNDDKPVQWAFPHSVEEIAEIGAGREKGSGGGKAFVPQLAVIVRPTPLDAVRDVSKANELMPQKSTFFYPKLATGLFINPLD